MSDIQARVRVEVLSWAKDSQGSVPNLDKLYNKLVSEGTDGHYVHAYYAKKLHECGRYRITDIEASTGKHDVDIQLNGDINIQVWYGMNTHGYIMEAQLIPGTPKSDAIGKHLGTPTKLGGVPTNCEENEKKILKKLAQLPDDTLGILLLHSGRFGYWVSLSPEDIPANKCVLNIDSIGPATEVHCPPAFSHFEEINNIAECLGLHVMPAR